MTFEEKRKAINDLRNMAIPEYSPLYSSINLAIEAIANYDSAEQVGQWEWNQYDSNPKIGNWHCSQCHGIGVDYYDYCPYCGSRMIQEAEE